jgi:hypothetical protein
MFAGLLVELNGHLRNFFNKFAINKIERESTLKEKRNAYIIAFVN